MKKIVTLLFIIFILTSCWNKNNNITESEIIKENTQVRNILALWDSLTAWYSLNYEDSYPLQLQNTLETKWYNFKVINAWVSGDTSKNLLSRIDLYNEKYQVVLLNIWWNDWLRSLSIEELKKNIIKIIDKFSASKIVLFSIDLPENYSEIYRNKLKEAYEEIETEKEIYYYWLFFEWIDYKNHFLSDQIHPNKQWYKIISENIASYLLENNIITND